MKLTGVKLLLALPLLIHPLHGRTWTSADGSKTFEAELDSYDASTQVVSVSKDGVQVTFTADKLSSGDQQWLTTLAEEGAQAEEGATKQGEGGTIIEKLKQVRRLTNGKMQKTVIGADVEFFILYYSASW